MFRESRGPGFLRGAAALRLKPGCDDAVQMRMRLHRGKLRTGKMREKGCIGLRGRERTAVRRLRNAGKETGYRPWFRKNAGLPPVGSSGVCRKGRGTELLQKRTRQDGEYGKNAAPTGSRCRRKAGRYRNNAKAGGSYMAGNRKKHRKSGAAQNNISPFRKKWNKICAFFSGLTRRQLLSAAGGLALGIALIFGIVWLLTPHPVRLSEKDGGLYDAGRDILYLPASVSYEPVTVKIRTAYAVCPDGTLLYRFGEKGRDGLDPEKWLSERYDGIGGIYYASDISLPELSGFSVNGIKICRENDSMVIQENEISDTETARAVVRALTEGEAVPVPSEVGQVFKLKATSSVYSGLYYNLIYMEGAEDNYLYDRGTQKCVSVGTLLLHYIARSDMEEDENSLSHETQTGKETADSLPETADAAADSTLGAGTGALTETSGETAP